MAGKVLSSLLRHLILTGIILSLIWSPSVAYSDKVYQIVIMPKLLGIRYYDAVKTGIDEADGELTNVSVKWVGPTQDHVDKQIEMIGDIISTKPDLIAVAANDPVAIVPILKKALQAGIRIMSWDGDTNCREFFVNLVDYNQFGEKLVDALVKQVGPKAEIAIITTTFTAPNQVRWVKAIKNTIDLNYPEIKILDIRPATESFEKSYRITQECIKTMPTLKGIIALGVPNLPGVAKAVRQEGLVGKIAVVGNSTPNLMRPYLKDGTVKEVFLWNAPDHGYLTVFSAYRLLTSGMAPGRGYKAGRLGEFIPVKDKINMQVALPVMVFTRKNVDQYNF